MGGQGGLILPAGDGRYDGRRAEPGCLHRSAPPAPAIPALLRANDWFQTGIIDFSSFNVRHDLYPPWISTRAAGQSSAARSISIVLLSVFVLDAPDMKGHGPFGNASDCSGEHHGNLTPAWISPGRPHCLYLWLDGSIMIPSACLRLRRRRPAVKNLLCGSLFERQQKERIRCTGYAIVKEQ